MITVGIDEKGQIYLDGSAVEGAVDVRYGVSSRIELRLKALEQGESDQKARLVLFKCDRNVDREIFEPVLAAISEGGGIVAAVGTGSQTE